jgi:parallel beta-helix repeat protein
LEVLGMPGPAIRILGSGIQPSNQPSTFVRIERCKLQNSQSQAQLYIDSGNRLCLVRNCVLTSLAPTPPQSPTGIPAILLAPSTSSVTIENCEGAVPIATRWLLVGTVDGPACKGVLVDGCRIYGAANSTEYLIYVGKSARSIIRNCILYDGQKGIHFENNDHPIIEGNIFTRITAPNIQLTLTSGALLIHNLAESAAGVISDAVYAESQCLSTCGVLTKGLRFPNQSVPPTAKPGSMYFDPAVQYIKFYTATHGWRTAI